MTHESRTHEGMTKIQRHINKTLPCLLESTLLDRTTSKQQNITNLKKDLPIWIDVTLM